MCRFYQYNDSSGENAATLHQFENDNKNNSNSNIEKLKVTMKMCNKQQQREITC